MDIKKDHTVHSRKTYNVSKQGKKNILVVVIVPVCPQNEVTKEKSHKRKKKSRKKEKLAKESEKSRKKYLDIKSGISSGIEEIVEYVTVVTIIT